MLLIVDGKIKGVGEVSCRERNIVQYCGDMTVKSLWETSNGTYIISDEKNLYVGTTCGFKNIPSFTEDNVIMVSESYSLQHLNTMTLFLTNLGKVYIGNCDNFNNIVVVKTDKEFSHISSDTLYEVNGDVFSIHYSNDGPIIIKRYNNVSRKISMFNGRSCVAICNGIVTHFTEPKLETQFKNAKEISVCFNRVLHMVLLQHDGHIRFYNYETLHEYEELLLENITSMCYQDENYYFLSLEGKILRLNEEGDENNYTTIFSHDGYLLLPNNIAHMDRFRKTKRA